MASIPPLKGNVTKITLLFLDCFVVPPTNDGLHVLSLRESEEKMLSNRRKMTLSGISLYIPLPPSKGEFSDIIPPLKGAKGDVSFVCHW